jgi:hypothetical protein
MVAIVVDPQSQKQFRPALRRPEVNPGPGRAAEPVSEADPAGATPRAIDVHSKVRTAR